MATPRLTVLSLRYSSWSMRPWLALTHAGIEFETHTVEPNLGRQATAEAETIDGPAPLDDLDDRRAMGSVNGLFPVLRVDGLDIHESLAICEWANEIAPAAKLWPEGRLDRARARSISCEMASGFLNMRQHLSCHPLARVPNFEPDAATRLEIDRVHELWTWELQESGGPFLFGHPTIADFMYFPVVTRFLTYGVALPPLLSDYAAEMWKLPAVRAWKKLAEIGPRIPVYDDYVRSLDGDPG